MNRINYLTDFTTRCASILILGLLPLSCLALTADEAMHMVKQTVCKEGLTIEQVLDSSIKATYQRDIGWRYFQQEAYVDIERAVLINKSSELRYRWRVDANGGMAPASDRAEKLCS